MRSPAHPETGAGFCVLGPPVAEPGEFHKGREAGGGMVAAEPRVTVGMPRPPQWGVLGCPESDIDEASPKEPGNVP